MSCFFNFRVYLLLSLNRVLLALYYLFFFFFVFRPLNVLYGGVIFILFLTNFYLVRFIYFFKEKKKRIFLYRLPGEGRSSVARHVPKKQRRGECTCGPRRSFCSLVREEIFNFQIPKFPKNFILRSLLHKNTHKKNIQINKTT